MTKLTFIITQQHWSNKHTHTQKKHSLFKLKVILNSSDIAASEYGNHIALSPINVQEERFSSKTKFVIKKYYYSFK